MIQARRSLLLKVTCLLSFILLFSAFKLIPEKKLNVVFIGDSITFGSNTANLQPSVYALDYLKSKTGVSSIKQSNQGVSGHTTVDFLPGGNNFKNITAAADVFYGDNNAPLIFSIMLGTNDSAVEGTNGAPVSAQNYQTNLKTIIDALLTRYPKSKVVINNPLWYSPNTQNGATYLAEGLARLQTYFPQINSLVKSYGATNPGHVFVGDTNGFDYFKKNYLSAFQHEQGRQGIFYLHPNENGAARLGELWGKAIYKIL